MLLCSLEARPGSEWSKTWIPQGTVVRWSRLSQLISVPVLPAAMRL